MIGILILYFVCIAIQKADLKSLGRFPNSRSLPVTPQPEPQTLEDLPNFINISNIEILNASSSEIKNKLISLIKTSKDSIDTKIASLKNVHDDFKQNNLYRLGYVVSYINKTYEDISDTYQRLSRRKDSWRPMRIWKIYNKLKTGDAMMSKILAKVFGKYYEQSSDTPAIEAFTKNDYADAIAWSYYDDNMSEYIQHSAI